MPNGHFSVPRIGHGNHFSVMHNGHVRDGYYEDDEEKDEFEDELEVCQDLDHVHCDPVHILHNI